MIEGDALKDLIEANQEGDMVFKEYFKHKFMYGFVGVDGVEYSIWCGDDDGDIYRDYWKRTHKVGELSGGGCVHFAARVDT